MAGWTNYGDIDYGTYGGYLCRIPDGGSDGTDGPVELIQVDPERQDGNGRILAVSMDVDTRAISNDAVYDILYTCGLEQKMPTRSDDERSSVIASMGRMLLAKEAASVLGDVSPMSNFNGRGFYDGDAMYMSRADVDRWLRELGAGEFAMFA